MTLVHPVSFESNDVVTTPEAPTSETPSGPTFGQLGLPQPLVTALERSPLPPVQLHLRLLRSLVLFGDLELGSEAPAP